MEKKYPKLAEKIVWRVGGGKKTPKEVCAGLGWQNQGWRKASRRQVRLEEEARGWESPHAPSHAGAWDVAAGRKIARGWRVDGLLVPVPSQKLEISSRRSFWYGRCRKKTSPEVRRKSSPAVSVFWRRSDWSESIGRWGRWPEWNTVTGRFPGVDDTGNRKELGFLPWLWYHVERERKKKNLNSHSCNVYLQLRNIYIYKARSPNYHTCDLH